MPNSSNSWNYGRRLATFDAYNWANIANYIPQRDIIPQQKRLFFFENTADASKKRTMYSSWDEKMKFMEPKTPKHEKNYGTI